MGKIPKVFANKEVKTSGNNKKVYYSESSKNNIVDKNVEISKSDINKKISDIFNSPNYIYKADVVIELKDGPVNKRIIGKNNTHLITMKNELIPISDIIDIKKL